MRHLTSICLHWHNYTFHGTSMNLQQAIEWQSKNKLFVSLAARPGKTGETFYNTLFAYHGIDAEYVACVCTDCVGPTMLTVDPLALNVTLLPPAQIMSDPLICEVPAVLPPMFSTWLCAEFQSLGRMTDVAVPSATVWE